MKHHAVGIDLGTSNSCIAILRNEQPEVLANQYMERTTASVVAFNPDGEIEVGNRARARLIHQPSRTVSSSKRLIGRYYFSEEVRKAQAVSAYDIIAGPNHSTRIQIGEEIFSLEEVAAMVLREMKQVAEAHLQEEVQQAVVTVPAYFNDNQRQATKDAGRIAGLDILRILNEPTAAALAYGFGRGLEQRVAVYDLGGGTFDISILEIGRDVFEVLATSGDTFLGGDDFDDRILDLLAEDFFNEHGINPRSDPFALEKLKRAAEEAKNTFSEDEEAVIHIPELLQNEKNEPLSLKRTLGRDEFDNLIADLIQRTFKVCDEALQQAHLTVRDLDGVILVGGPTRLPVIQNAVQNYFQQVPRADVDPDEVVAVGAAIHAASLVNAEVPESILLDVTPLDLRVGVVGGLAESIIERNTPVPIEQTRRFTTSSDFQERVSIRVYQGDQRKAAENEMLGEFTFSDFDSLPRGEVNIDVTFEINADGIVQVTASEPSTGQAASTTLTLTSGLSGEELDSIVQSNRTARVASSWRAPRSIPSHPESESESESPNQEFFSAQLEPSPAIDLDKETSADPEPLPGLDQDDTPSTESE
ncbi:MAG: molecular chaperone DnaK [Deltaproteobacteria bacterium]|nr:molecular chaperone DnaK [Deltaproteobacteria bacterium]